MAEVGFTAVKVYLWRAFVEKRGVGEEDKAGMWDGQGVSFALALGCLVTRPGVNCFPTTRELRGDFNEALARGCGLEFRDKVKLVFRLSGLRTLCVIPSRLSALFNGVRVFGRVFRTRTSNIPS